MGNLTVKNTTKKEIDLIARKLNISKSKLIELAISNFDSDSGLRMQIIEHVNGLRLLLPTSYEFCLNTFQAILCGFDILKSQEREIVTERLMKLQSDISKRELFPKDKNST